MFRYVYYRVYSRNSRTDDPFPQIGATLAVGAYVQAVALPLIMMASRSTADWVPGVLITHPYETVVIAGLAPAIAAYFAWTRNGAYKTLGEIYDAEPRWKSAVRAFILWLWLLAGGLLFWMVFTSR